METIAERIKQIINIEGFNISSFEKECELSNNSIQTAIKRNSGVRAETLNKILLKFNKYNPTWLLTGKGDMLLSETGSNQNIIIKENSGEFNSVGKAGEANIKSKNKDAIGIGAINDKDEEIQRLRDKVAYLQGQVDLLKGMIGE